MYTGFRKTVNTLEDMVSEEGQYMRTRIVEKFHGLNARVDSTEKMIIPSYDAEDVKDPASLREMLLLNPDGLVMFLAHSQDDELDEGEEEDEVDIRLRMMAVRLSRYPPLDIWSHWLLADKYFKFIMLLIILGNSIVLAAQTELGDMHTPESEIAIYYLDVFDTFCLIMFVVEILLKWLDDFKEFWGEAWNIFDFVVTFTSLLPAVMGLLVSTDSQENVDTLQAYFSLLNNLRVLRIFRALKMVTRFKKIRVLMEAIIKAGKSMLYVLLLLLIMMYIFSIVGIFLFERHTRSGLDLKYKGCMGDLLSAVITLVQLTTLDHWFEIMMDLQRGVESPIVYVYVILWIMIGHFIFFNLFVAVMVNDFQAIRSTLGGEVEDLAEDMERYGEMANLEMEVPEEIDEDEKDTEDNEDIEDIPSGLSPPKRKDSGTSASSGLTSGLTQSTVDKSEQADSGVDTEWFNEVLKNFDVVTNYAGETVWPRDTLFRYMVILEALCENMEERDRLYNLACDSLLMMYEPW